MYLYNVRCHQETPLSNSYPDNLETKDVSWWHFTEPGYFIWRWKILHDQFYLPFFDIRMHPIIGRLILEGLFFLFASYINYPQLYLYYTVYTCERCSDSIWHDFETNNLEWLFQKWFSYWAVLVLGKVIPIKWFSLRLVYIVMRRLLIYVHYP